MHGASETEDRSRTYGLSIKGRLLVVVHTERRNNGAAEAANMAKYAAAEAGLHALDAAIQTHGGNGLSSEYGLADLWGMVRLLRIAPVSREMVLNFVAQQSLGLPKSY